MLSSTVVNINKYVFKRPPRPPPPLLLSHLHCVFSPPQSLRKRYHALKDQADVEEVRVKVEDCRRELQAEFDKRRGEMEMELEQKRRELMEGGHRLARARAELEEKRKELLESSHGLSEVIPFWVWYSLF